MMVRFRRCLVLFVFSTLLGPLAYAQEKIVLDAKPNRSAEQPLVLLNSTIIVALSTFAPADIQRVQIYKEDKRPPEWVLLGLGTYGIIDISSAKKLRTQKFRQLAKNLHVRGPVTYALDGQPITGDAAKLRIATSAIGRVEVQPATTSNPSATVAIWTALPPPVVHPPGTIRIRGVSTAPATPPAAAR